MVGMPSERFNVSVPSDLYEKMEQARGDVSRSKFVKRALESALDGRKAADSQGLSAPSRAPVNIGPTGTKPSEIARSILASDTTSSRAPGDPAAVKAKREAPPDRRVKGSAEARKNARPVPKAGKR